jgi:serine/threonine-protein kinase
VDTGGLRPPVKQLSLAEGDFLGRFRIVRELGRGGMGVVYEALQAQINRPVAIKVILAGEFATPADLRRFQVETEAVAWLDHPNIVPIHEVGEEQGRPYFSMKLCPGGSLDDHLDRYRADPRAAAQVAATVARAVDHAHRRGVLHRDLKPGNILLDAEGAPLVADFGLARRLDSAPDLTRAGALLGSPPYMAPEQAAGNRGDLTVTTDVYGLGAVLYTLLSGRPPFRGETPLETLDQVRHRRPDPPTGPDGRLDRDLQTVCLKCLEKDPRDRYESAAALADDLERWSRGEPIRARPAGLGHQLWLWARRPERIRDAGRYALGLGTLLSLYVLTGLVLLAFGAVRPPHPAGFALFLVNCLGIGYLPVALVGWATLRGYRWAIPIGFIQGLGGLPYLVGHVLGLFEVAAGGAYIHQDSMMIVTYDLFFAALSLLLALAYALAFVAGRSRRAADAGLPVPQIPSRPGGDTR